VIVVCFQAGCRATQQGLLNFAFGMHLLMVPVAALLLIFRRHLRLAMRCSGRGVRWRWWLL
jgi:hypothetical protein